MSTGTLQDEVVYEDSDGRRLAENTLQFEWIVTLKGGLEAMFRADPNVFVAGDLLWYPVEGLPKVRVAPDAMVAIGRPKGYRGSYRQWVEGGVAPQVVFEVLSPANRPGEMAAKKDFYEKYGVEEYYVYDPDNVTLAGYLRDRSGQFDEVPVMDGHASPRLGVRFELADELVVHAPGGKTFLTYLGLVGQNEAQQIESARERRDAVEAYAKLVEQADARQAEADRERRKARRERAKAEAEREKTAVAEARVEALRARLRAAGIDPDAA